MSGETRLILSLREDIVLSEAPDARVTLQGQQFSLTLAKLTSGVRAALSTLSRGGATESQLNSQVLEQDGFSGMMGFKQLMSQLAGIICHTLWHDEQLIAVIEPLISPSPYRFQVELIDDTQYYLSSRFACCHRVNGQMLLESPLSTARVVLCHWQAGALWAMLTRPYRIQDMITAVSAVAVDVVSQFLNFLLNAQVIAAVDEEGTLLEDRSPTLAQWEFHDLLFHTRSRLGRHNQPYGGSYRFQGKFEPLPVVKLDLPTEVIPLYKPNLEQLKANDASFTTILEKRRSIRHYNDQPLTAAQLGEFLYRAARIKQIFNSGEQAQSVSFRPYPGGGACYELEIYPIINQCQGMAAGLYYYNPLEHQLHKISDKNRNVETLLTMAWHTANREAMPQVCLAITARFQRIQWKYQSMSYALILKNVGVLQQTMYLIATAMGLAPCALGGGHSDLFANAADLNYYKETTVGEFMLGSSDQNSSELSQPYQTV